MPEDPRENRTQLGQHEVDVPAVCVITRFGLRSPRHLLPTYLDYRRVAADARAEEGLLRAAFLVEDPSTCYSLSIWEHDDRISGWRNDRSHVEAARRIFGRLRVDLDRGPEIWSTKWRLMSVSHNLTWPEFPFDAYITSNSAEAK